MATKWRIYCTDPSDVGWQEVWSDTSPNECPNNASHSVNLQSVQELEQSQELFRINVNGESKTKNNYERLINFQYIPIINGIIRTARVLAYMDSDITNFDIQIFDVTNQNELVSIQNDNTIEEVSMELSPISNVPSGNSVLELSVKKNGGKGNSKVYVNEIIFYS